MHKFGKILVYVIVCFVLIVLLIRILWLQSFHVGSASMTPTILSGENVFISKPAYGYSRYSFPLGGSIKYFSGRIWGEEPTLGDVVVFRSVPDQGVDFVKRIVGLPGDRVQMKEGILYINDSPCLVEFEKNITIVNDFGKTIKAAQFKETLPNGRQHLILKQVLFGKGQYDNTPVLTVPPGHYFMMGDNRDESHDSRGQGIVGNIPFENLVGRADFIASSPVRDISVWTLWKYQGIQ